MIHHHFLPPTNLLRFLLPQKKKKISFASPEYKLSGIIFLLDLVWKHQSLEKSAEQAVGWCNTAVLRGPHPPTLARTSVLHVSHLQRTPRSRSVLVGDAGREGSKASSELLSGCPDGCNCYGLKAGISTIISHESPWPRASLLGLFGPLGLDQSDRKSFKMGLYRWRIKIGSENGKDDFK